MAQRGGCLMAQTRQPRCWSCGQFVAHLDGLTDSTDYADESDAYISESWHLCPREGK
jgi:hypothetical protein